MLALCVHRPHGSLRVSYFSFARDVGDIQHVPYFLLSLSVAAGAGVIAAFAAGCFALTSVGCADVDPPPWVRGRLGTGDLDLFLGICFALAVVALKLLTSRCGLLAAGPALSGLAVRF